MKAVFIDCPPFLHELYRGALAAIVPDLAINLGSPSRDEVKVLLAGAPLAMNDHTLFDEALLAACPSLKAIVFLGTGAASYIDLKAAERQGIRVRAYGGYGDQSVAEHAIALMFAAARKLAAMDRALRAGHWETLEQHRARRQDPRRDRHRRHRPGHGAARRRPRHAGDRLEPQRRGRGSAVRRRSSSTSCCELPTWSRFIWCSTTTPAASSMPASSAC